jgi:hypothetical protein
MVDWKARTLYDRIVDRWGERESAYSRLNTNRDVIVSCFRPDEAMFVGEEKDSHGDSKKNMDFAGQDIYNGGGPWYSQMMATGFQGSLVSKNIDWIRYQMKDLRLKGVDELDVWNQDIKEYMSDVYQLGNFYKVQPQFTLNGLTIGSPVMFGDEDEKKQTTMWKPQYYKNVRVFYDGDNEPEGVIVRDRRWTAKQIHDEFVGDDPTGEIAKQKLTMEVNRALSAGKLNDEFTVYRAVFRVSDPIWDSANEDAFKKPVGNWTWLSVYMLETSDAEKDKRETPLNDDIGYFSQPFTVWDFDKKPWEVASRSPAWYAIWDCMGLNQVHKQFLENGQLKNRPPRYALNTMKNRMALSPEGEMYVTDKEYDRPPRALDMIGDVALNKEIIEIYDEALKRWFYIDRFAMFSTLARDKNQPVSATQIIQMMGEKSTLLSPAIETHSSYLETADARMIDIEVRAGRGPFDIQTMENITDIVIETLGASAKTVSVAPVFIGPLAQAQKISQAIQPIQSTMEAVVPLMDIWPELKLMYREYETANDINEALDFPQKNIVPQDEYQERVAAANQAAAQQQQQENAVEMMKASKNLQGPVDESSVMANAAEAV